jgi:hypothetical protein
VPDPFSLLTRPPLRVGVVRIYEARPLP